MTERVRGAHGGRPSPALRTGCLAIFSTAAAFGGIAFIGSTVMPTLVIDPPAAAAAGFVASGVVVAIRALRSRRTAPSTASSPLGPHVSREIEPKPSASAPNDRMTPVDVADLAEAIATARISRVVVPFAAGEGAREGIALARRLSGRRASTVFVDFGARGVAQEMGLIDAPSDLAAIAASPSSFAHSIHRDRASGAHVIAVDLGASMLAAGALADAAATVLDALGEAYARTVVAIPADRLGTMPELIDDDTAIVVPASSAGEAAMWAFLGDLENVDIGDVLLVSAEAEARRLAVA